MSAEGRIDPETVKELERRGHKVDVWDDWTPRMGALNAITIDRERETLQVGADLRRDNYAMELRASPTGGNPRPLENEAGRWKCPNPLDGIIGRPYGYLSMAGCRACH